MITDTYNYPEFEYGDNDDHPYQMSNNDGSFERGEQSPNAFEVIHEEAEDKQPL
jgi:hypothetical protein